jgi:hypothetical protein
VQHEVKINLMVISSHRILPFSLPSVGRRSAQALTLASFCKINHYNWKFPGNREMSREFSVFPRRKARTNTTNSAFFRAFLVERTRIEQGFFPA